MSVLVFPKRDPLGGMNREELIDTIRNLARKNSSGLICSEVSREEPRTLTAT